MDELDKLLRRLTESAGVGYAGTVKDVVLEELKKNIDNGRVEQDGTVFGHIKGIALGFGFSGWALMGEEGY